MVSRGGHAQVLSQVDLAGGEVPRLGGGQGLHQGGRPRAPRSHPPTAAGRVLAPLVHRAPPGVHEEVSDCGGIQAELPRYCNLHFF